MCIFNIITRIVFCWPWWHNVWVAGSETDRYWVHISVLTLTIRTVLIARCLGVKLLCQFFHDLIRLIANKKERTTNSSHFIYSYIDIRHKVKDHTDSERNQLSLIHGQPISINSKYVLYAPSHCQDNTYHIICKPIVGHWLEWEKQW